LEFINLKLKGAVLIKNYSRADKRGVFIKPFTKSHDYLRNLDFDIEEVYYSISKKNVIRGMHFQHPPMDHAKFIYLTSGKLMDVLLDLRKSSNTYKNHIAIELSEHKNALFIPPGIAHGYLSMLDGTTVVYNQSTVYSQMHDDGILWNSFGYKWRVDDPILSERDKTFSRLDEFKSPFI